MDHLSYGKHIVRMHCRMGMAPMVLVSSQFSRSGCLQPTTRLTSRWLVTHRSMQSMPGQLMLLAVADFKQAVYDMNYYIAKQHFSIVLTTPNTTAFCQPWLKGYNGQAFAADFSVGAPLYGGFYLSRFWVDSSVKNSTTH